MNPSAQLAPDSLVAGVLRRAHRGSETNNDPNEARAILNVAQCFADELSLANPEFDRLRFMKLVMEDPS